jgi:periplasmic divalent cation tolerance protein
MAALVAVWITINSLEAAQILARKIVTARLAACVNIIPQVQSVYMWEGDLQQDSEVMLMAKTRQDLVPQLTTFVKENHPYQVPEVIAAPLLGGNEAYFRFVRENTNEL